VSARDREPKLPRDWLHTLSTLSFNSHHRSNGLSTYSVMSNHNKENENSTRPRSSRHRKVTARVQHTRDAQSAAAQALQLKKRKKAKRRALKQHQNESELTVERPEDTDEIRELRGA
jgi:hypothetical protein